MITDRKSYNEYVAADLAVAYVPKNPFKRLINTLGGNEQCAAYRYVHRLRKTEYHLNTGHKILYHYNHFLLNHLGLKFGIKIAPNKAGKGLNIIHLAGGGGCILNCTSIGDYCRVQSGVVVGNVGDDEHRPIIGNHVGLGLGCKVYGKITIGDNVTILPNAVVTHDVPANAIVGGVPAKIIKYKELNIMEKKQRLISICIPTYNRPSQLKRMLESIDTTKIDDIDIVISENCSPQQADTRKIVEEYTKSHPYEVHYFENERNLGYDKNIRACVARATGRFCVFFSDDDMAMPGALDEYIEFVHNHKDCGYILRSYRNYDSKGGYSDFYYYPTDKEFPAGRDTAIKLFNKSVFLSGFTIRQEYAKEYVTDALDGSLLYQMYLLLHVCRRYPSAYSRILISKSVPTGNDVHYFGTGDGEEGYKNASKMTGDNLINFISWYVRLFKYVEDEFKDGTGAALLLDFSNLIYPTMATQLRANPNKKDFKIFCNKLFDAGVLKTTKCLVYYYCLLVFGVNFCDLMVKTIKQILGRRPNLT